MRRKDDRSEGGTTTVDKARGNQDQNLIFGTMEERAEERKKE
jgi:hypothetical protein